MASWGQMGAASRALVGVGGAAVVTTAGALTWWMVSAPPPAGPPAPAVALMEPAAVPEPVPQPAPEQVPLPVAEPEPAAEPVPLPLPEPVVAAPEPPTFDLVRVESDGAAQVAGRGVAGAVVTLLVDDAPVAEAPVARDGSFVALFTLAPNPKPSLLSLRMRLTDGTEVAGRDTVALAPIAGPVIAAVAPEVPVAPEPAPPAALLVTDTGVKVLQTPEPAAVAAASVSIDTIAYTPDGAVQFGGRGAAAQTVRLYLDNADLAETAVADDGQWAVTEAGIAPGVYTLRADQLDGDGTVTSRFETPFKRETIAALEVASAPQAPEPAPEPAPVAAPEPVAAPVAGPVTEPAPVAVPAPEPPPVALALPAAPVAPPPAGPAAPLPAAPVPEVVQPAEPSVTAVAPAAPEPVAAAPEAAPPTLAAADPAPAPTPDAAPVAPKAPVVITVQPGLTLWAIAEERFGSGILYVQVFEANKDKIRDPDLIYPGQVFTVPVDP